MNILISEIERLKSEYQDAMELAEHFREQADVWGFAYTEHLCGRYDGKLSLQRLQDKAASLKNTADYYRLNAEQLAGRIDQMENINARIEKDHIQPLLNLEEGAA